jgi:hypothetical protein
MRDHAREMLSFAGAGVVVLAIASASAARAQEADPNSAPNPTTGRIFRKDESGVRPLALTSIAT